MPRVKKGAARTPLASTSRTPGAGATPGPTTRITWGHVECREFMRYPSGGSGIPEEDPSTLNWVLGMTDAVPVRNAAGEVHDVVHLPVLRRAPSLASKRSCVKGARAAGRTVVFAEDAAANTFTVLIAGDIAYSSRAATTPVAPHAVHIPAWPVVPPTPAIGGDDAAAAPPSGSAAAVASTSSGVATPTAPSRASSSASSSTSATHLPLHHHSAGHGPHGHGGAGGHPPLADTLSDVPHGHVPVEAAVAVAVVDAMSPPPASSPSSASASASASALVPPLRNHVDDAAAAAAAAASSASSSLSFDASSSQDTAAATTARVSDADDDHEDTVMAAAGRSAGATAAAAAVGGASSHSPVCVAGLPPPPAWRESRPGVRYLGTVAAMDAWKHGYDHRRRAAQIEELRASQMLASGGGRRKKLTPATMRLVSAAAAGIPIPLFRPLAPEERRELFARDALPSFLPLDRLAHDNAASVVVAKEILKGRRDSKIGEWWSTANPRPGMMMACAWCMPWHGTA